jgi:nicotinate phosphoribosyltransferase
MAQCVYNQIKPCPVEYEFKCRNAGVDLRPFKDEIEREIDHLCTLRFQPDEIAYLKTIRFIDPSFLDVLRLIQLNRDHVRVYEKDGELKITISGNWLLTIWFEVPVLAIVNEVYFRNIKPDGIEPERVVDGAMDRLLSKIKLIKDLPFKLADFGTRRRFSLAWQDTVVKTLARELPPSIFVGTSNVFLAKKYGVKAIGTMAHEFIQCGQAQDVSLASSQKYMLEKWADEFRGSLGTALSDTISMDAFLADFDLDLANRFDSVRIDSGDPIECCNKLIDHYRRMGIDPMTKTAIFSDGLDFSTAHDLSAFFDNKIKTSFGIGTNLTNDIPGFKPLNIVIKMTRCNDRAVAKISESPGKSMCTDTLYLAYLKSVFDDRIAKFKKGF